MIALPILLPLFAAAALSQEGCLVIHGTQITGRELAREIPEFRLADDPDKALAPAPRAGLRKDLSQALLNDWLRQSTRSSPVDSSSALNGNARASALLLKRTICVEQIQVRLSKETVEKAIRHALGQRDIVVVVEKFSTEPLPPGRPSFPLSGAARPSLFHPDAPFIWRGMWRTMAAPDEEGLGNQPGADATDNPRSPSIWAVVRAYRFASEVRVNVPLAAGTRLKESQLEATEGVRSAFDESPNETPQQYVGLLLKRFCASGSLLSDRVAESAPVLKKDSMVSIEVICGDLHLKLTARAETDGWSGQVIPFVVPAGHRRFLARVQPQGSALLVVGMDDAAHREIATSRTEGERGETTSGEAKSGAAKKGSL